MAHPRFFTEILGAGSVELPDSEARHARLSRRLSVDDPVMLFDGRGREAKGRIVSIKTGAVQVAVDEPIYRPRPSPALTLALALPKGTRQGTLIEKCTELGVADIIPIATERSISSASAHKLEKWKRTTIEAVKQSGQCWLPELHEFRNLPVVLSDVVRFDRILFAALPNDEQSGTRTIADLLAEMAKAKSILACIGPEGGWTKAECALLVSAGAQPVSLGPNTLRAETAAIAVAAAVHALMQKVP